MLEQELARQTKNRVTRYEQQVDLVRDAQDLFDAIKIYPVTTKIQVYEGRQGEHKAKPQEPIVNIVTVGETRRQTLTVSNANTDLQETSHQLTERPIAPIFIHNTDHNNTKTLGVPSIIRDQESSLLSPKSVVVASEHIFKLSGQMEPIRKRNNMNIFDKTQTNSVHLDGFRDKVN